MPAIKNYNLVTISTVIMKEQNKFLDTEVKARLKGGMERVSKSSLIREALNLYIEKVKNGGV